MDTILITKKEYEVLKQSQRELNALEYAGVDNWDGYEEAYSNFIESEKENDR